MWASKEGHVEVLAKLAELGADIAAIDNVSQRRSDNACVLWWLKS